MAPRIQALCSALAIYRSVPLCRTYATKETSPTSQFYKTFARPIAKTLLTAVFTYQVIYWSWLKLETDEIRSETDATIADLEGKVEEYKKKILEKVKS